MIRISKLIVKMLHSANSSSIISLRSMKSITNMKWRNSMEKDKFVGVSKVGEKGQIVIPKEAREMFDIKPGDSVIVLCDKNKGIALLKADAIEDLFPKGVL